MELRFTRHALERMFQRGISPKNCENVFANGKIIDDGIGLPTDFNLATSSNLGLQIVRTLTENELKGTLRLTSTALGTTAVLRFPL